MADSGSKRFDEEERFERRDRLLGRISLACISMAIGLVLGMLLARL